VQTTRPRDLGVLVLVVGLLLSLLVITILFGSPAIR
jgi:tetrahydromethanopterin S-methyltransferase subunit G